MVSNQTLQVTLDGLWEITGVHMAVLDPDARVLAATMEDVEQFAAGAMTFAETGEDSMETDTCVYYKVYDEKYPECILLAKGSGEETVKVARIAAFQISNLLVAYKERFDKDNFIKNLLMDNLLLVDIFNRAKKLHIETTARRVVFILENVNVREGVDLESVRGLAGLRAEDFVSAIDERDAVIIRELLPKERDEDLEKLAVSLRLEMESVAGQDVHVAYGTVVEELKDVSRSFKEAKTALDVGRVFFEERGVIAYSMLGIGRLIYQLPLSLCRMFIQEIFDGRQPDDFGDEMLQTIYKFFENNLNVSETARKLYIHRNTLVYRLDKLQKMTGLDLRVFEDAITFKIALMVVKYMKYIETIG